MALCGDWVLSPAMKRFHAIALFVLPFGFGSVLLAYPAPAKPGTPPAVSNDVTTPTAKSPAKPALAKGMTAEEVIKAVGKPVEIKPIESKDGKAETWIYRRKAGFAFINVPAGTREVPVFTGVGTTGNDRVQNQTEIIYTQKRVTVYQVTSLLMFNDRLVLAKQSKEQSEVYD